MRILGALGLDWKIFLIQATNFLILFLILKWIFFKPFIASMQEEKEKAEEIKKAKESISQEKEKWQKEKAEEILKTKKKVDAILTDTEMFAEKIKKENKESFLEEQRKLLEKVSHQSQAIADEYKKSALKNYREKTFSTLIETLKTTLSIQAKTDIQNSFWPSFIKKIDALKKEEIIQMLQRYENKIPPLTIYSSLSLTKTQKDDLQIILKRKLAPINLLVSHSSYKKSKKNLLPKKLKIKKNIQRNLIAGFQLEIDGLLIEENLKNKIEKIIKELP